MNRTKKIVVFLAFMAVVSVLFVSFGNPFKGKVFYLEVFGKEASTLTFKDDGTYEVNTPLGLAETGHWTYEKNFVKLNPGKRNEVEYRWDEKDGTLTEINSLLPKIWKLKKDK